MIARFLKRIELDIQSGFAYPPLPLSLRHRKCIFKPPFDVLFTGLSRSWTAGKLCKWCKSNIRECNSSLSTSALNLFACSRVQSVLKNNLWYSHEAHARNLSSHTFLSQHHGMFSYANDNLWDKTIFPALSRFILTMRYFSSTLTSR